MVTREKLAGEAIAVFVGNNPGWADEGGVLAKTFTFGSYADGIAFVVRVGFAAEARDHHPDLHLGWRKVKVAWTTHDSGGITGVDLEMARRSDELSR